MVFSVDQRFLPFNMMVFISAVKEDPTKTSGEEEETIDKKGPDVGRENGEEDAVDMTQDFGGDVADLPEEDEESESKSCN